MKSFPPRFNLNSILRAGNGVAAAATAATEDVPANGTAGTYQRIAQDYDDDADENDDINEQNGTRMVNPSLDVNRNGRPRPLSHEVCWLSICQPVFYSFCFSSVSFRHRRSRPESHQ